jgi:hypothetical protein
LASPFFEELFIATKSVKTAFTITINKGKALAVKTLAGGAVG